MFGVLSVVYFRVMSSHDVCVQRRCVSGTSSQRDETSDKSLQSDNDLSLTFSCAQVFL